MMQRPVKPSDRQRANLPRPLPTPLDLVGRMAERALLTEHLRAGGRRLVTLLGPGGIGKTSLALRVAADLAASPAFADGVAVALLAPVATADDVPIAIAASLGVPLQGARPALEQLVDALRDQELLLVLDNLEHLLRPGDGEALTALIARLLAEVPGLRVLATSRERLRLRDEQVLDLGGLALPASDSGPRVERSEAVRLFVERAQRVSPAFALSAESRTVVAQICRRLEGMPLAIELAASWTRALAPHEIAEEIERSLDFLSGADRDTPARHRSMRAALDHSWQLLDNNERRALAQLSVFRGGWDRDAAVAVVIFGTGATDRAPTSSTPSAGSPTSSRDTIRHAQRNIVHRHKREPYRSPGSADRSFAAAPHIGGRCHPLHAARAGAPVRRRASGRRPCTSSRPPRRATWPTTPTCSSARSTSEAGGASHRGLGDHGPEHR